MGKENNKSQTVQHTRSLAQPIADELGLILWDVRFEKEGADWFLRIIIDSKEGEGVSFDQCEALSRRLDPLLDEEDFIPQSYYLEVSSPGLMRPLRRPEHFTATIGMEVEVKLYQPRNGQRQLVALLEDYQDGVMTLKQDQEQFSLPVKDCTWVKRHDDLEF